jgi:hypothetical protein
MAPCTPPTKEKKRKRSNGPTSNSARDRGRKLLAIARERRIEADKFLSVRNSSQGVGAADFHELTEDTARQAFV